MRKQLYIIGAGTGSKDNLTDRAVSIIKSCGIVYSTKRLSQLLSVVREDIYSCPVADIIQRIIESQSESIGILVSGDTGFFSMTKTLLDKLSESFNIEIICGISSMQYFCSKIGASYENMKVVSMHGRETNIFGAVAYNQKVFILTGGNNKAEDICKSLTEEGLGAVKVTAGENLSMSNERVVKGSAIELSEYTFEDLTVLLIENPDYINCCMPLCDTDFIRGKIPMTKEEIRWIAVAKLAIEPYDVVYDIGAGTGTVALEMARKAYDGRVYAIEQKIEAIDLIKQNRQKLGGYNVSVIHGNAPEALLTLPKPDKAFIGGSSGNMSEIVSILLEKNPRIKLVANAITLETLHEATTVFEKYGLETTIISINTASSKKIGSYHMMQANNPIYIITGIYRT